jgi:hypothetical protein
MSYLCKDSLCVSTCGCYLLISGTNSQKFSRGVVFVQKQFKRGCVVAKETLGPPSIDEVRDSSVI